MQADPTVQRLLLDLAKIDADLARVGHRRRTSPELAEIEKAELAFRDRRDALISVQVNASDLDREVVRQEKEIESVRAREDRDRKLLESGSLAVKQMADVEHELESLQRRQAALEDDLLELMERREALELDIQRTAAEVDQAESVLSTAQERWKEILTDLDTTQSRREADRVRLLPRFPDELVQQYDRVRVQRGIGAALLQSRRCGSCRLELDRATMGEIKAAAPALVIQCENCSAILVRTEESGL